MDRALSEARNAGWWFRTPGASAHVFGVLYCRRTRGSDFCRFAVQSTGGSDSEQSAHLIREKLAKCQHADLDREPEAETVPEAEQRALRGAHFHMDRAQHLLGSIEQLLDRQELRDRATALIDSAMADTDDAEKLLGRAAALDEESERASQAARDEAGVVGLGGPPWPPQDPKARLVDPAEQDLHTADGLLDNLSIPDVQSATQRLASLKGRLDVCRARLRRRE